MIVLRGRARFHAILSHSVWSRCSQLEQEECVHTLPRYQYLEGRRFVKTGDSNRYVTGTRPYLRSTTCSKIGVQLKNFPPGAPPHWGGAHTVVIGKVGSIALANIHCKPAWSHGWHLITSESMIATHFSSCETASRRTRTKTTPVLRYLV